MLQIIKGIHNVKAPVPQNPQSTMLQHLIPHTLQLQHQQTVYALSFPYLNLILQPTTRYQAEQQQQQQYSGPHVPHPQQLQHQPHFSALSPLHPNHTHQPNMRNQVEQEQ